MFISIPKMKRMEEQRRIEQKHRDSVALERAWKISDSVRHQQLMEDPDFMELYEENQDLKERLSENDGI
jgi:hypothetical protein